MRGYRSSAGATDDAPNVDKVPGSRGRLVLCSLALALAAAGCVSSRPPEPQTPIVVRGGYELHTQSSDVRGEVHFADPDTSRPITVSVEDGVTLETVPGLFVWFFEGDGFEVFVVTDPTGRYRPSVGIDGGSPEHDIRVVAWGAERYTVSRVDSWLIQPGDLSEVDLTQVVRSWVDGTALVNEHTYRETLTYGEWAAREAVQNATSVEFSMMYLPGLRVMVIPADGVDSDELCGPRGARKFSVDRVGLIPLGCTSAEPRWDVYSKVFPDPSGSGLVLHQTVIALSQPPRVANLSVRSERDGLFASWDGRDDAHYASCPPGIDLPSERCVQGIQDSTVLLGPTFEPDLTFHYRLARAGGESLPGFNWTATTDTSVSLSLRGVDVGDVYSFEIRATDEVDNVSETLSSPVSVGEDAPP